MRFVLSYPVLSVVSNGYPRLRGRLPTCYSPVRHGIATIRLACIRHAASVNPEPGSNSPKNLSFVLFFYFLLLFFFRIALLFASSFFISSYTVFKDLNWFTQSTLVRVLFNNTIIEDDCQYKFYLFLLKIHRLNAFENINIFYITIVFS